MVNMSLACYKHSRSICCCCCCHYYYMLLYYPHPISPIWPPSTNPALQAVCLLTPESALGQCSEMSRISVFRKLNLRSSSTALAALILQWAMTILYSLFLNNNEEPRKKRIPLQLVYWHHEGVPHPNPEVTSWATLGRFSIPLTATE